MHPYASARICTVSSRCPGHAILYRRSGKKDQGSKVSSTLITTMYTSSGLRIYYTAYPQRRTSSIQTQQPDSDPSSIRNHP